MESKITNRISTISRHISSNLTAGTVKTISTPDLSDEFGEKVKVLTCKFEHFGAKKNFGGEVVTVKCFEDNSKVGEQVRNPGNGRILLVDGGASPRRSLLGDNLARSAMKNGWAGIVVYGYIRDIEEIEPMEIGILALGTVPVKTEKRGLGDINVPVTFGGVTIKPGNYLYADKTGVIISETKLI